MPVIPVARNGVIYYEGVPWPAECKLEARHPEDMTRDELRAELAVLMGDREEPVHAAFCINPACPAKR